MIQFDGQPYEFCPICNEDMPSLDCECEEWDPSMRTFSKKKALIRREGFWTTGADSQLAIPRRKAKPWSGHRRFLDALAEVERSIPPHQVLTTPGFSTCRICIKKNGSHEYVHQGWTWPSGFSHYAEVHLVRPSLAFEEFIIGEHLK